MPRPASSRKKVFPVIAGSPSMITAMFSIRDSDLTKAMEDGLPVHKIGARRRILVEDAVTWFRTLPHATRRKARPHAND